MFKKILSLVLAVVMVAALGISMIIVNIVK